jgi:hypothetical protein
VTSFQKTFDTFTHYKSILIRDLGFVGEKIGAIRYPPYDYKKLPLLEQLLKNRCHDPSSQSGQSEQFSENDRSGYFFQVYIHRLCIFWTKNGWDYIFGDFYTNSSGHPASRQTNLGAIMLAQYS